VHDVCNLRLIGRHVGPVVVWAGAVDGVVGVEWGEVERCDVQERKVPAVGAVDPVESRVDAIGVVGQAFIGTCESVRKDRRRCRWYLCIGPSVAAGEAWNKA